MVGKLLQALPADDATALTDAMESGVLGTQISRALKAEGHDVSGFNIQRHRNGICKCESR